MLEDRTPSQARERTDRTRSSWALEKKAAASSAATEAGLTPLRTSPPSSAIFAAAKSLDRNAERMCILDHRMHPAHILLAAFGLEFARGFERRPGALMLAQSSSNPRPSRAERVSTGLPGGARRFEIFSADE